ncbi:hypothetical protein AGJ34_20810 [Cronobacter dublinensis subsp. dublinensis]|nr:hypothetical protein [Cronobacter dublinensis subsp. dublinensis]EGT5729717.1 hypothetical protein [Cronobacter dublinensis subsp. dublinensis]
MTLRQAIVRNINMFRDVPLRSLLWLDLPGAGDLVECREVSNLSDLLSRFGHPESVLVHLDTPDGDFEDTFRIRVSDLQNPPVPASKRNGAQLARDKVVARFGLKKIDNVERLAVMYASFLLERFRASHGYRGPEPRVRVRWHTKISWGGSRGITISPGYLYSTKSDFFGFVFREYRHVSNSPDTGNFVSLNRLNHVKALVAHELAHFLQQHASQANLPDLDYSRAHGEGWQYIYASMREDLNKYIAR